MAHVLADRVLEVSTTAGAGPFTLAGAAQGFRAFSAVCAVTDTVPYYIEAVDGEGRPTGEWEYGLGTYAAANQLTRSVVRGSSNAGLAVAFGAGTKLVGLGVPAPNSASTRSEWRAALGLAAGGDFVLGTAQGGTGQNDPANAFNAIKQAATETATGVVELATVAEAQALADAVRALTPARLASAFQGANQALGGTGYQRLPGGIILQWGNLSVVTGGQVVSYALAFPAICYSVVATAGGNNAASNTTSHITAINTANFTLTNASGTTNDWKWWAVGR